MNAATIFLVTQILTLAAGFNFPGDGQNANYCNSEDGIRALDWDTTCTRYFQCADGLWTVKSCQAGTVIDLTTGQCTTPDQIADWARPECKDHAERALEEQLKQERLGTSPEADNTAIDGKNPYICLGHDPHTPIAHRDCNKYRQCVNGFWHTRECGPDTVFDVSKLTCTHTDQAWGCGLEAETTYQKKVEEWIAQAKEKEAEEQEEKEESDADEGPIQPTIFANFRGLGGTFGDGQDFDQLPYEYPLGGPAEEATLTDPSEFVPREGSTCQGPGLFPVAGKCGVYLQCAPDSLLMVRHCPFQTYFEPTKSKCNYKEHLVRADCNLDGDDVEEDDLSGLPSATLLEKLVDLAQKRDL